MCVLQLKKTKWCLPIVPLTSGEASLLVTLGELHVEIGDQRVDVVVPLNLQAERWGKRQILRLHCVDVHLLLESAEFRLWCCEVLKSGIFPSRTIPHLSKQINWLKRPQGKCGSPLKHLCVYLSSRDETNQQVEQWNKACDITVALWGCVQRRTRCSGAWGKALCQHIELALISSVAEQNTPHLNPHRTLGAKHGGRSVLIVFRRRRQKWLQIARWLEQLWGNEDWGLRHREAKILSSSSSCCL